MVRFQALSILEIAVFLARNITLGAPRHKLCIERLFGVVFRGGCAPAAHLSVLQHLCYTLCSISRTLNIGIALFLLFQAELLEIIVLLTAANLTKLPLGG